MKKVFITNDEEIAPGDRISHAVGDFINGQVIDTVNEQYVVIVEIIQV